ncbi:hypothetical protein Poli38472_009878 [Pythium oligandrum]|uniref:Uncharacterized protein n=1 Tax=Pythium oligandrum TaxID=41045 RepID=A0A8K1FG51_PYTOL|nr:hypothetical protein Poli38472_009878 [Pythium oligandrum]|eukprot:TMW62385.1 hypothetical protein Poli38472_009878 [Pythium oligandrum]
MAGDGSEEELRLLEAMAAVSQGMQQLNQVLTKLNRQAVELSTELRTAERQMNALYLPFQAAIYEIQSANKPPGATTPGKKGGRTEL